MRKDVWEKIRKNIIGMNIEADTYSTLVKIRTDLTLQVNQEESMDMIHPGPEQFFEQAEIVV